METEPFSQFWLDATVWLTGHAPRLTKEPVIRHQFESMYQMNMLYGALDEALWRVDPEGLPSGMGNHSISAENWPGPMATEGQRSFPTQRRVLRRETDNTVAMAEVEEWFHASGVVLGPLVPEDAREDVMRTLWTYRDVGAGDVSDIPATDLYTHVPRLKDDIKPWNRSPRKRWTEPQKYWLNRLVSEGIESGMFEYTSAANGSFLDWSAEPVLVLKDLMNPWAEYRLTVNYSYVNEDMPGTHIPLLTELHDNLSDPRIGSLSVFDLKHAYWSIPVNPDWRYVFAFAVPGFS